MPRSAEFPPCPTCGAPVAPNASFGQCPRCLLGFASGTGLDRDLPADDLIVDGQKRRIAGYELVEEIARGGMGIVYRARQTALGREVALKMLASGDLATDEAVRRFQNEASAAAGLKHPNIVPVYEIGEEETGHFFSMRLVPGNRNVADWARDLPVSGRFRRIAAMMATVARAIAHAHGHGVLHRDLKPSNLLVDEDGEPQVTDFGLARLYREVDSGITLTRQILGSPSYMAPEQAEGRRADETTLTDVYGLGAVLYEMLAGRPPFVADSPIATARKVVEETPARLPEVPRDLGTICLKCLEKESGHRYVSALALAEDLERFARGEPIRARPLTTPEALWRWAKRRPKTAALLGLLMASFVIGFGGVFWQWRKAEQARAEQQKAADHLRWQEIVRQADGGETPLALARLATILRASPENWRAAMLAMSIVDQNAFPRLAGPAVLPDVPLATDPRLAPDGRHWAGVFADGSVRVYEVATGREYARLPTPSGTKPIALALGDGPFAVAIACEDGSVQAHASFEGGGVRLDRPTGTGPVQELRFSVDGSRLFARSADAIEFWETASHGLPPGRLTLAGGVSGASIAADGKHILVWNAQGAALRDAATGQALLETAADARFRHGALAAGGGRVALIDGLYQVRTWEVTPSGDTLPAPTIQSPLSPWIQAVFNHSGSRITLMSASNDLTVVDTATALPVSPPMRHLYFPTTLVISGDGLRTASYGLDGRICRWDAATGRSTSDAIWLNTDQNSVVDLSRDGRTLLVHPESLRDAPAPVFVWRETSIRPPRRHAVPGQRDFNGAALTDDGTLAAVGLSPGRRATVYEPATGRVLLDADAKGDVYAPLFSPDRRRFYAFTANGWRHAWDLRTGAPLWPPSQAPGLIRPGAISPDGTRLIAGHNDGHVRIYDAATGDLLHTLDHPGEVKTLRFAPDPSGRFISGSTDGVAHLWDVHSGKRLLTLDGHASTILSSAWSPDSRLVATASFDKTARVWDAATGRPVGPPLPHLTWLSHLEFSPDGRLLATACRDGTVRLWYARSGLPASAPLPQGSTAEAVRFTADGACFLVRDHLGFRFWSTDKAEPVTLHYPEPVSGGTGLDDAAARSILNSDGTRVFLGSSVNEAAYWSIEQPREPVPAWFPDFLESLALLRFSGENPGIASGEELLRLQRRIAAQPDGPFAEWARRVLSGSEETGG